MASVQFKNMFAVDVEAQPVERQLSPLFLGDQAANRVGAYLLKNGQPYAPGGSCAGTAILSDGSTVALSGTVSGNEIYVDLPPACYAVPGPMEVFITWSDGAATATVVHGHGSVARTDTGRAVDPGTVISSVAALITSIQQATASIPADYSGLLSSLAPDFSEAAPCRAGDFVWHGGTLYRARENVPAGTWNQAKFEPVIVSGGLPFTIGGNNTLELIGATQSASQFLYYDVGEAMAAHVGETVTVSFDLMGTVAREIRVYPYQNIGVSIADTVRFTPSVGTFSRVSFTTTVTDYGGSGNHAGRIGLYDDAGAQTLTTRRFKIERGHVATPWAMSAQDAVISAQAIAEETGGEIAPVETGSASARNYAAGALLIWKNALYRATATIATGDALAVGTNLAGTTMEAELAAAKAACALKAETALSPTLACLAGMNFVSVNKHRYSGRILTVDRNHIQVTPSGSTLSTYFSAVLTNALRVQTGSLASFVPVLADLVPISQYPANCDIHYYLDLRDNSTGASSLQVVFASIGENDAISILDRGPFIPLKVAPGMRSYYPLQPPTTATHFMLFYYSGRSDHDFDCTFEIIPRTAES